MQKSTGGKQKLGSVSKMGELTLRRLMAIGACAVIKRALLQLEGAACVRDLFSDQQRT